MNQDDKIKEMIKNIDGLKQDVKDLKEVLDDSLKGQKEIEKLLKLIEKDGK